MSLAISSALYKFRIGLESFEIQHFEKVDVVGFLCSIYVLYVKLFMHEFPRDPLDIYLHINNNIERYFLYFCLKYIFNPSGLETTNVHGLTSCLKSNSMSKVSRALHRSRNRILSCVLYDVYNLFCFVKECFAFCTEICINLSILLFFKWQLV